MRGLVINDFPSIGDVVGIRTGNGVSVQASEVLIEGNLLGTDPSGTVRRGNQGSGVWLAHLSQPALASNTATVGGPAPAARNVIAFNTLDGILVGHSMHAVENNLIHSNGTSGVEIRGRDSTLRRNTIHSNTAAGVLVTGFSSGNRLLSNSVFGNSVEIDLEGVSENDECDTDEPPSPPIDPTAPPLANNGQNFPEITEVAVNEGTGRTIVEGILNSTPGQFFLLQFFASDEPDPSGRGPGQTFLGETTARVQPSCNASFSVSFPNESAERRFITATATNLLTRDTSEFSPAVPAGAITVTTTRDVVDESDGLVSLAEAITYANEHTAPDTIAFDIPSDDPGHLYYQDDGVSGQISRDTVSTTTEVDDADISDIDPDWPHSWFSIESTSLPPVSDPVAIDGYTQAGATPNTIDSQSGLDTVLKIEVPAEVVADDSDATIRGLAIHGQVRLRGSSGHVIAGNFLGTDVSGTIGLQGERNAVHIQASHENRIGGTDAADRNRIWSGKAGIWVDASSDGNRILSNLIRAAELAIDLAPEGATPNDECDDDEDGHGNNGQNFPEITDVTVDEDADTTLIEGVLVSTHAREFLIQFFASDEPDYSSARGVGQTLLGETTVTTTDGLCQAGFSATFPRALTDRRFVAATATDLATGNTSEFSFAAPVPELAVTTSRAVVDDSDGLISLAEAITYANHHPGLDTINFTIPPDDARRFYYQDDGVAEQLTRQLIATTTEPDDANVADIDPDWPHTWLSIQPKSELPHITEAVTIDGYTQAGASPNTNTVESREGLNSVIRVEIDGSEAESQFDGLTVAGGSESVLRGLTINRFPGPRSGIVLEAGSGHVVAGNYLGTDVSGTVGLARSADNFGRQNHGVRIGPDSGENRIGGTDAADRNLVADAQSNAIVVDRSGGNKVQGNLIGTDRSGTVERSNSGAGVALSGAAASGNRIGGTEPGSGNVISGSRWGVSINATETGRAGGSDNTIQGNLIGTDVTGTAPIGNRAHGVLINSSSENLIGGTEAAARNIISATAGEVGNGIAIVPGIRRDDPTGNVIQGNYIGTDITGTEALGNSSSGISLGNRVIDTVIGGTEQGAGNVISDNQTGISMSGSRTIRTVIQGNLIGTDAGGTQRLGNRTNGVHVTAGAATIGGPEAGAGNVIAASGSRGLVVSTDEAPTVIQGNFVGTDRTATVDLGNGVQGVLIGQGAEDVMIGGESPTAGNTVAFSDRAGIEVQTGAEEVAILGNTVFANGRSESFTGGIVLGSVSSGPTGIPILGNSIFDNVGLGIDLHKDGVTENDPGDADDGANNRQNFPVLDSVASTADEVTVNGTFASTPETTFRLEFFASPEADESGHGEGRSFLGSADVTTDAMGNATFSAALPTMVAAGDMLTATATRLDENEQPVETSEFSEAIPVTSPPEGDFNGSGTIEQGDLDLVLLNWGTDASEIPSEWVHNLPSGIIDQEELDAVLLNWGATAPAESRSAARGAVAGTKTTGRELAFEAFASKHDGSQPVDNRSVSDLAKDLVDGKV